ncbi:MAG: hypothetical protein V3U63_10490, partial [Gemmatimonadota bacterium]
TPEVDSLLQRLEREYEEMDVDGFVSLFTEDFTQHDVNRRVRISRPPGKGTKTKSSGDRLCQGRAILQ